MAARREEAAGQPPPYDQQPPANNGRNNDKPVVAVSLLQPRVAVLLDLPRRWHPLLFGCRLLSIWPTLWSGLRFALRFLVTDFLRWRGWASARLGHQRGIEIGETGDNVGYVLIGDPWQWNAESRLRVTETVLSMIWVGASAYLAFLFTDSQMSRWLVNYSPIATTIRLVTSASIFAFISSWTVYIVGGDQQPALLLPAWIGIATTLTLCYHITQRKINIRKETSATISVFSIASFISMVALLLHLHVSRWEKDPSYPDIPLNGIMKKAAEIGGELLVKILGV